LEDLSQHNCLVLTNSNAGVEEWIFRTPDGRRRVRVHGNFQTNNHEALYVAALSGLGIAHMPKYVASPALASGELVTLFGDAVDSAAAVETVNAYYPQARNRLKRVNAFIDFLIEHFRGQGAMNRGKSRRHAQKAKN
jgi:DNA-binding transcriptional LysR family regulator